MDLKDLALDQYHRCWFNSGLRYLLHSGPVQDTGSSRSSEITTRESFPEPWNSIWVNITPPVRFVLTYMELADDLQLSNQADQNRIQLFRNIMDALNLPSEQRVFWPINRIKKSQWEEQTEIFWNGIEGMNPNYIICFGENVFKRLFPDRHLNYGQFTTETNLQVLFLPGPERMLPDNREVKKQVWNFLKQFKA